MSARRLALVLVALGGCELRANVGSNFTPQEDLGVGAAWLPVRYQVTRDVDILFVVDDSAGMRLKQDELRARLPAFVAALDPAARLHLGVVTSDLGAGATTTIGNCRPGGGGARLQALGRDAPVGCLPPVGKPSIESDGAGGHNLPGGQDLATTLGCMMAVGDAGCGFEQPLEVAFRAVAGLVPENQGFIRRDALLVVVFVTDEDDCSAPDDTDLFDEARSDEYGPLSSYRCTRFGLVCDQGAPPLAAATLDNCRPAERPSARLLEVGRYIDLFSTPGAAKDEPSLVMLATLAGPSLPVASVQLDPLTRAPCDGPVDGVQCTIALAPSCTIRAPWSADPAVRLQAVARAAPRQMIASICGDLTAIVDGLAQSIVAAQQPSGCLSSAPLDRLHPDCTVIADGQALPPCADAPGGPCWQLDLDGLCAPRLDPRTVIPARYALRVSGLDPALVESAACLSVAP